MSVKPTRVEAALLHLRPSLIVVLVVIPVICWIWVIAMARDMYGPMTGASAWMMSVTWDAPRLVLLWAMWAAMMAGMMLPSAAPILLLYARTVRNRADQLHPARAIYALGAGYVLVWAVFSVAATALQRIFASLLLLTPMMEPATPAAAAALLLLAGIYQLTPFKRTCLDQCRSPIMFLTSHWREGVAGAFRMGVWHGVYCLGCCWGLMLLLFAGGVMNLVVILTLTVWVAIEKIAPFGEQSARVSGALLLGAGVWMLLR
jgi:predicted metal-binding membrane protein